MTRPPSRCRKDDLARHTGPLRIVRSWAGTPAFAAIVPDQPATTMLIAHDTSSLPGGCSHDLATQKVWQLINKIGRDSDTAHAIATEVHNHQAVIKVACFDNRDGCFGASCSEIGILGPVILWDFSKNFRVRGRTITGRRKWNNSLIFSTDFEETDYPPELVLLHEIGHAKQYLEDPGRFSKEVAGGQVQPGTWKSTEIEADNLERHERPVAEELGLRVRQNYDDYLGFS